MSDHDAVQAKVDQLAQGFLARLPARLDKIDAAFALCTSDASDPAPWQELYRLLHSLGGAAGTFGVAAVGSEARRIELRIEETLQGGSWQSAQVDQIGAALDGLRALAAQK